MHMIRSILYTDNRHRKLACLVAGFAGKIRHFNKAIHDLQVAGYDVVAFEYDNDILDKGESQPLHDVVAYITKRLEKLAPDYNEVLCTGVSLGAYIAVNVQRNCKFVTRGVYGTAGVLVSHVVFHAPVFIKIERAFVAKGFTEASLREAWLPLESRAPLLDKNQKLFIVLGGRDRIVRHDVAVDVLDDWIRQGVHVRYFTKPTLGHSTTIRWYKNHLGDLLARSGMRIEPTKPRA